MKVQIMSFGTEDVLRINDVDRPAPGAGEVLMSVEATSVNGHDVIVRAGEVKMVSGRRFPIGAGLDFAGTGVEGYRVGDRVWGMVHPRQRHSIAGAAESSWSPRTGSRTPRRISRRSRRSPWWSRAPRR